MTSAPPPSAPASDTSDEDATQSLLSLCPALEGTTSLLRTIPNPTPGLISEIVKNIPENHLIPGSNTHAQFEEAVTRIRSNSDSSSHSASPSPLSSYLDPLIWNSLFDELDARKIRLISEQKSKGKLTEENLSKLLKEGTKISHAEAESVSFVKNFIRGKIEREHYVSMQAGLYYVYETLEAALDTHKQSLGPLYQPQKLRRLPSLSADLTSLVGPDWQSSHPPSPATLDYINRLKEIASTDPVRLIAHSYTRYFGDLSGGQILKKRAKSALQLPNDALTFYEFTTITEGAKSFKNTYRDLLDTMKFPPSPPNLPSTHNRLVGEANVAFVLNMRLFEELDVAAKLPSASVRPYSDATAFYERYGEKVESKAECPFGFTGGPNPHATKKATTTTAPPPITTTTAKTAATASARCPWPFVFMHDPSTGLRDWQTFLVVGLVGGWVAGKFASS